MLISSSDTISAIVLLVLPSTDLRACLIRDFTPPRKILCFSHFHLYVKIEVVKVVCGNS